MRSARRSLASARPARRRSCCRTVRAARRSQLGLDRQRLGLARPEHLLRDRRARTRSASSSARTAPSSTRSSSPRHYLADAAGAAVQRHDDPAANDGTPPPPPPPPPPPDLTPSCCGVPRSGSQMHVALAELSDSTAAGNSALRNPDHGAAKIAPALVTPANYFEASFDAQERRLSRVGADARASDSISNDSVHLQFSDRSTPRTTPLAQIGSEFVRRSSCCRRSQRAARRVGAGRTTGGGARTASSSPRRAHTLASSSVKTAPHRSDRHQPRYLSQLVAGRRQNDATILPSTGDWVRRRHHRRHPRRQRTQRFSISAKRLRPRSMGTAATLRRISGERDRIMEPRRWRSEGCAGACFTSQFRRDDVYRRCGDAVSRVGANAGAERFAVERSVHLQYQRFG